MEKDKTALRDGLIAELWRMNKMDIILHLREFVEGETAALWFLRSCETATPSQISENLNVSRARAANILRSLRQKGFVEMEIASSDRRKMDVRLTDAGRRNLEEKYAFLVRYFDLYVDVLGGEDIAELTRLLRKTADCEALLATNKMNQQAEERYDR